MKQMNQKFLATIICVVQCQISMFNLQTSFMTVNHHKKRNNTRGDNVVANHVFHTRISLGFSGM